MDTPLRTWTTLSGDPFSRCMQQHCAATEPTSYNPEVCYCCVLMLAPRADTRSVETLPKLPVSVRTILPKRIPACTVAAGQRQPPVYPPGLHPIKSHYPR
jgi:hypothetical protein